MEQNGLIEKMKAYDPFCFTSGNKINKKFLTSKDEIDKSYIFYKPLVTIYVYC